MKVNYDGMLGQLEIMFTVDEKIKFEKATYAESPETIRAFVEEAIRDVVFNEAEDPCEDCIEGVRIADERCEDCDKIDERSLDEYADERCSNCTIGEEIADERCENCDIGEETADERCKNCDKLDEYYPS